MIQNDAGNRSVHYPNTIVLAMSTKGRPVPFHIRIEPSATSGLRETTYIKCEQILTISKARLIGRKPVGRILGTDLGRVEIAVMLSLGIGV